MGLVSLSAAYFEAVSSRGRIPSSHGVGTVLRDRDEHKIALISHVAGSCASVGIKYAQASCCGFHVGVFIRRTPQYHRLLSQQERKHDIGIVKLGSILKAWCSSTTHGTFSAIRVHGDNFQFDQLMPVSGIEVALNRLGFGKTCWRSNYVVGGRFGGALTGWGGIFVCDPAWWSLDVAMVHGVGETAFCTGSLI